MNFALGGGPTADTEVLVDTAGEGARGLEVAREVEAVVTCDRLEEDEARTFREGGGPRTARPWFNYSPNSA